MRFKADSAFAPKLLKAWSLRESVVQRMIHTDREKERERAYGSTVWTDVEGTSQGCVTAEWERLTNEQPGCIWAFGHVWEGVPPCPFLSELEISPFENYRWKMLFHRRAKMECEVTWCRSLIRVYWCVIYGCHPLTHTIKAKWFEALLDRAVNLSPWIESRHVISWQSTSGLSLDSSQSRGLIQLQRTE